jgi:hypothetical protein
VQLGLAVLLPVLLTWLLMTVCLTLHRWSTAAGGGWLFDLPERRKTPAAPADLPPVTGHREPVR